MIMKKCYLNMLLLSLLATPHLNTLSIPNLLPFLDQSLIFLEQKVIRKPFGQLKESLKKQVLHLLPLFEKSLIFLEKKVVRKPFGRLKESLKKQVHYTLPLAATESICTHVVEAEDAQEKPFIIKANDPLFAFLDVFGSFVSNTCGITGNYVRILPENKRPTSLKETMDPSKTYTIHSFVYGSTLVELGDEAPFKDLDIDLDRITPETLEKIAHRNDLLDIIALDIFMLNMDRHGGNYIYNKYNDSFIGIDMDHCLYPLYFERKKPLHKIALAARELSTYLKTTLAQLEWSSTHIKALKRIRATLKKLMSTFPAKKLVKVAYIIAHQTNWKYTPADEKLMKELFDLNHQACLELIAILDGIIAQ
jgi:hypothetical protein